MQEDLANFRFIPDPRVVAHLEKISLEKQKEALKSGD
jgi:hypothetical protein